MLKDTVVDLSHWNSVDFKLAKKNGIVGVLHKATQGVSVKDAKYPERAAAAKHASIHWGAYHFGTGADGAKQAKFFLDTINAVSVHPTVVALDIERNPSGSNMTPQQADDFVKYIHQHAPKTLCLIYGSPKYLEDGFATPTLTACPLWLAHYTETPSVPKGWHNFVLWQHTNGKNGPKPHSVNGIGNCDRDKVHVETAKKLGLEWF